MAKPSSVAKRYLDGATPARSSRPRSAATPAFVCVKTSTGLGPWCRDKALAISCVLPHPAGAVTAPFSILSRSISGSAIFDPREHALDDRAKLGIAFRQGRPDNFPAEMLHCRHVFEPRSAFCLACLSQAGADKVRTVSAPCSGSSSITPVSALNDRR